MILNLFETVRLVKRKHNYDTVGIIVMVSSHTPCILHTSRIPNVQFNLLRVRSWQIKKFCLIAYTHCCMSSSYTFIKITRYELFYKSCFTNIAISNYNNFEFLQLWSRFYLRFLRFINITTHFLKILISLLNPLGEVRRVLNQVRIFYYVEV